MHKMLELGCRGSQSALLVDRCCMIVPMHRLVSLAVLINVVVDAEAAILFLSVVVCQQRRLTYITPQNLTFPARLDLCLQALVPSLDSIVSTLARLPLPHLNTFAHAVGILQHSIVADLARGVGDAMGTTRRREVQNIWYSEILERGVASLCA